MRALLSEIDSRCFTVIELVIAIPIIGTLASIAIMLLLGFKEKGHVLTLTSDLGSAYEASVQYHMD